MNPMIARPTELFELARDTAPDRLHVSVRAAPARMFAMALIVGLAFVLTAGHALASGLASEWSDGHASRVRLIAGPGQGSGTAGSGGSSTDGKLIAGVEIDLQPGWKTYWRNPGEAGGVPPEFDWSASENVAAVDVAFPAPNRMPTEMGDLVGYKDDFVVPVTVTPKDTSRPVKLALAFHYGVCRDICIPAEANLALTVEPGGAKEMPAELKTALSALPREQAHRRDGDPELTESVVEFSGKQPRIGLTAHFTGSLEKADLFVEAPAGIHLPMAHRVAAQPAGGGSGGVVSFEIDLNDALDIDELKGQTITVTLAGENGQSIRRVKLK